MVGHLLQRHEDLEQVRMPSSLQKCIPGLAYQLQPIGHMAQMSEAAGYRQNKSERNIVAFRSTAETVTAQRVKFHRRYSSVLVPGSLDGLRWRAEEHSGPAEPTVPRRSHPRINDSSAARIEVDAA